MPCSLQPCTLKWFSCQLCRAEYIWYQGDFFYSLIGPWQITSFEMNAVCHEWTANLEMLPCRSTWQICLTFFQWVILEVPAIEFHCVPYASIAWYVCGGWFYLKDISGMCAWSLNGKNQVFDCLCLLCESEFPTNLHRHLLICHVIRHSYFCWG